MVSSATLFFLTPGTAAASSHSNLDQADLALSSKIAKDLLDCYSKERCFQPDFSPDINPSRTIVFIQLMPWTEVESKLDVLSASEDNLVRLFTTRLKNKITEIRNSTEKLKKVFKEIETVNTETANKKQRKKQLDHHEQSKHYWTREINTRLDDCYRIASKFSKKITNQQCQKVIEFIENNWFRLCAFTLCPDKTSSMDDDKLIVRVITPKEEETKEKQLEPSSFLQHGVKAVFVINEAARLERDPSRPGPEGVEPAKFVKTSKIKVTAAHQAPPSPRRIKRSNSQKQIDREIFYDSEIGKSIEKRVGETAQMAERLETIVKIALESVNNQLKQPETPPPPPPLPYLISRAFSFLFPAPKEADPGN